MKNKNKIITILTLVTLIYSTIAVIPANSEEVLSVNGESGTLEGYVRDTDYNPISDAYITIENFFHGVLPFVDKITVETQTDENGYLNVEAPGGHYYIVRSGAQGYLGTGMAMTYVIEEETTHVEMTLIEEISEEDIGILEGHVLNTRGKGIEGAQIMVVSILFGFQGLSGEEGAYRFETVGDNWYQIVAMAECFKFAGKTQSMGMQSLTYTYKGQTTTLDIYIPQINVNIDSTDEVNADIKKKNFDISYEKVNQEDSINIYVDYEGDGSWDYEELNAESTDVSLNHVYTEKKTYNAVIMVEEGDPQNQDGYVTVSNIEVEIEKNKEKTIFLKLLEKYPLFKNILELIVKL